MNKSNNELAMIETSSMKEIHVFNNLKGDIRCFIVTNDDKYLLVCSEEEDHTENKKPIKRGRVTCYNIDGRSQSNTLAYDGLGFKTMILNDSDTLLVVSDYSKKLAWIDVTDKMQIQMIKQEKDFNFNTGSMCFKTKKDKKE